MVENKKRTVIDDGEVFEIEDMPVRQVEPVKKVDKKIPKEVLDKEVKKINNDPVTKENGLIMVSRKLLYTLIIFIIVFIIAGLTVGIWFNVNFGKLVNKDFTTNVPVTVEGTNVTTINNYQIINNITFPSTITIKTLNITNAT